MHLPDPIPGPAPIPAVVNDEISETDFLPNGHLGVDSRLGFFSRRSSPAQEALQLLFGTAGDHHHAVVFPIGARLHHERGVHHGEGRFRCSLPLQPGQPTVQFLVYSRVHDTVQPLPLLFVPEDGGAQLRAIDDGVVSQDPGPEPFHDVPVGRLAGKDDLVGHVVGIDAADSQLAELVQGKALAAGDPTRESDLEHGKMIAACRPSARPVRRRNAKTESIHQAMQGGGKEREVTMRVGCRSFFCNRTD